MSRRRWFAYSLLTAGACAAIAVAVGIWTWRADRPEEHYQQALTALEQGDLKKVWTEAEALGKFPSHHQHVHLLRSALHARGGDPEEALEEIAAITPEGELRAPALRIAGECLYQLGRLPEAASLFQQLSAEHPEDAKAHGWLGSVYYDLGAMDDAARELKLAADGDPDNPGPHHLLGQINYDFEKFGPAAEHYRLALARNPQPAVRADIMLGLAEALLQLHDYAGALPVLDEATVDAHTLAMQSECRWRLGERDEASRLLEEAKQKDPNERLVLLLSGTRHLEAGEAQAAIAPLEQALERDPHDFECRYQLAQARQKLGDTEGHEQEIAQMQASQKLRTRLAELNVQATKEPGNADVRDQLAEICQTLGKPELATMWRRAAEACRQQ